MNWRQWCFDDGQVERARASEQAKRERRGKEREREGEMGSRDEGVRYARA